MHFGPSVVPQLFAEAMQEQTELVTDSLPYSFLWQDEETVGDRSNWRWFEVLSPRQTDTFRRGQEVSVVILDGCV